MTVRPPWASLDGCMMRKALWSYLVHPTCPYAVLFIKSPTVRRVKARMYTLQKLVLLESHVAHRALDSSGALGDCRAASWPASGCPGRRCPRRSRSAPRSCAARR